MFNGSHQANGLFRDETVLSTQYTPDTVVGRDHEQQALETALTPLTRGAAPENVVAYGPAGTGKTTTVTHVCQQLAHHRRVQTVHINCWQYNTRSALLSQLLIELGYPAPRKGKPVDELLRQLHEWIAKHHSLVVVLDEFDRHQAQTDVIYDLYHASTDADNELGVVLISNRPPAEIHLEPRSRSRLNYRPIHFPRYDADTLHPILQARAATAFQSDAVSNDALEQIADRAASMGGDCRHAIELLHHAGRIAARAQADTVTREHVEQSINPVRDSE